jgi:hypothetical protein
MLESEAHLSWGILSSMSDTFRGKIVMNDGSVPKEVEEKMRKEIEESNAPLLSRATVSRLAEIRQKIEDPNCSQVELAKLIAVEMTAILEAMNKLMDNASRPGTLLATKDLTTSLTEQLKGVRELGKQITEMDNLAKRDYINFDGDKFLWVLDQLIELGCSAIRSMGWEEHQVRSWENHFRKHLGEQEERIRRDADKQVWQDDDKHKAKKVIGAGK